MTLFIFLTQFTADMRIKLKERVSLFDENYVDSLIKNHISGDYTQQLCRYLFYQIHFVRAECFHTFLKNKKRINFINLFCALTNTKIVVLFKLSKFFVK